MSIEKYLLLESSITKSRKSMFNPKSDTEGDVDDIDVNLVEDVKSFVNLNGRDILPTFYAKLIFDDLPDQMLVGSKELSLDDKVNGRSEVIKLIRMLKEEFRLKPLRIMTWKSTGDSFMLINPRKTLKFILRFEKRFELTAIPNY